MNTQEAIHLMSHMDVLNPYARQKSEAEREAQARALSDYVLAEVPLDFAMGYVNVQARDGHTVQAITEITAAWARYKTEQADTAVRELVAPDALADDADAWLTWNRTARQTYRATGSLETSVKAANRAVGHIPELEAASPVVPREESIARLQTLMRDRRINRAMGGDDQ